MMCILGSVLELKASFRDEGIEYSSEIISVTPVRLSTSDSPKMIPMDAEDGRGTELDN